MFEDKEVTGDGPMEGTAGPDSAQICGTSEPINLYLAAKNLVEADGFMVLVYLLAFLGKKIISYKMFIRIYQKYYGMHRDRW